MLHKCGFFLFLFFSFNIMKLDVFSTTPDINYYWLCFIFCRFFYTILKNEQKLEYELLSVWYIGYCTVISWEAVSGLESSFYFLFTNKSQ